MPARIPVLAPFELPVRLGRLGQGQGLVVGGAEAARSQLGAQVGDVGSQFVAGQVLGAVPGQDEVLHEVPGDEFEVFAGDGADQAETTTASHGGDAVPEGAGPEGFEDAVEAAGAELIDHGSIIEGDDVGRSQTADVVGLVQGGQDADDPGAEADGQDHRCGADPAAGPQDRHARPRHAVELVASVSIVCVTA
jgi:hypothetical protein